MIVIVFVWHEKKRNLQNNLQIIQVNRLQKQNKLIWNLLQYPLSLQEFSSSVLENLRVYFSKISFNEGTLYSNLRQHMPSESQELHSLLPMEQNRSVLYLAIELHKWRSKNHLDLEFSAETDCTPTTYSMAPNASTFPEKEREVSSLILFSSSSNCHKINPQPLETFHRNHLDLQPLPSTYMSSKNI